MLDTAKINLDPQGETDHLKVPLFSMKGAKAGPRLVVTANSSVAQSLAERLWDLPNLVRMHGVLIVRPDDQDPVFDLPDDVLSLRVTDTTQAYYQLLGRMTALGMISGRGVPQRWVA